MLNMCWKHTLDLFCIQISSRHAPLGGWWQPGRFGIYCWLYYLDVQRFLSLFLLLLLLTVSDYASHYFNWGRGERCKEWSSLRWKYILLSLDLNACLFVYCAFLYNMKHSLNVNYTSAFKVIFDCIYIIFLRTVHIFFLSFLGSSFSTTLSLIFMGSLQTQLQQKTQNQITLSTKWENTTQQSNVKIQNQIGKRTKHHYPLERESVAEQGAYAASRIMSSWNSV